MLLKNPTKSGIKAEAVDPSWRPVVVGVLAFFPLQKLEGMTIWM